MRSAAPPGPLSRWLALSLAALPSLAALALLWQTRRATLALPPLLLLDAPAAFMLLAASLAIAAESLGDLAAQRPGVIWWPYLRWSLAAVACLALQPALVPLALLLAVGERASSYAAARGAPRSRLLSAAPVAGSSGTIALDLVAIACLAAGAALAQRGAALGTPLIIAWLLAACRPLVRPRSTIPAALWLMPLLLSYRAGPWNIGWGYAALLLGVGAALLAAIHCFASRPDDGDADAAPIYAGLALAGIGLGSGAGIIAACFALLVSAIIVAPRRSAPTAGWMRHALTPAFPLAAPFIACWMVVGAAAAGGAAAAAGVIWLAALLLALRGAIGGPPMASRGSAVASLVIGIAAPPIVRYLLQPVAEQLQGGLTLFGDLAVWPWVGLAAATSARVEVAVLPTLLVAGMMLVLLALVALAGRPVAPDVAPPGLGQHGAADPGDLLDQLLVSAEADRSVGAAPPTSGRPDLLRRVAALVPWLGPREPPHDAG